MESSIVGTRLRETRRAKGVTQAELARRIGISPSYLNLIERNRRRIAGRLLSRAARELDLSIEELDGAAERRVFDALMAIAGDPRLAGLGVEGDATGEMLGRYPGWARAVAALARAEREASDLARALSDRLTHDPFLRDAVHGMLSGIAAIRSAADILASVEDLDTGERGRFLSIVGEESRRLGDLGEALVAYFDRAEADEGAMTPLDEVDALFSDNANRFAALEGTPGSDDPGTGEVIDAILEAASRRISAQAATRARRALADYADDAARLPAERLAAAGEALAWDVEAMAREVAAPYDLVCRRLAALPPGEGRPVFGYVEANAAGALLRVRELPGFAPVRHGPVCALWALCRAQQTPERPLCQRVVFPTGERWVFVARARMVGEGGWNAARHYLSDMLVMSEADARQTVYLPKGAPPEAEPVGPACRACPRPDCAHRVADPLAG